MTPKIKDYVIPDEASWEGVLCPGAVGSKPNLVDIQAQIEENHNAMREERKARALAIPCPWCRKYHIEMQPPVKNLIGGESIDDFKEDSPTPVTVEVNPDTVKSAIAASLGGSELSEDEDDGLDEIFGTEPAKSSSGSSSSNSSTR